GRQFCRSLVREQSRDGDAFGASELARGRMRVRRIYGRYVDSRSNAGALLIEGSSRPRENSMKKGMLAVVTLAILGCASLAMAEERAASVTSMTRAQFEALAPEASIDINGTKMTKREFQARNQKAAEEAAR